MSKRVYKTPKEYRTAVLRDNETRKALSGICNALGTALIGAAAVRAYSTGYLEPEVGGWFLAAAFLIVMGVAFVRALQSER